MLGRFRRRGGETANNPDGWGLAFQHDGRFVLHKEPLPAANSDAFLDISAAMETDLLIGHVRKARLPRVNSLANTHPFRHSCCGRDWVFAHNGLVPDAIELAQRATEPQCTPAGATDSEHAFCHLLENVARHFQEPPADGAAPWITALGAVSEAIASRGKFNFLISDGDHLIAYGHDRLHYLEREEGGIEQAWIATEPLTEDRWWPFAAGELRVFRGGRLVGDVLPRFPTQEAVAIHQETHHAAIH